MNRTVLLFVGLTACSPPAEDAGAPSPAAPSAAPAGEAPGEAAPAPTGSLAARTRGGLYHVALTLNPSPPELSRLFEVQVRLTDATTGEPVPQAQVHVDAQMPSHGHGMSTDPIDELGPGCADAASCVRPGGLYLTRGMKFHMPGPWTLTVEVDGPKGKDVAVLGYEMPA